eukprot:jgi/Mesvir1/27274/Mv07109-RA.1
MALTAQMAVASQASFIAQVGSHGFVGKRQPMASQSRPVIKSVLSRPFLSGGRSLRLDLAASSPQSLSQRVGKPAQIVAQAAETNSDIILDEGVSSLNKISLGFVGLNVGLVLLSYGFGAYFNLLPGAGISALMLTYGFPLTLIGFALKYAELKPVNVKSTSAAIKLRSQITPVLEQVKADVTRFRYGDEQHLDEALKRIFRFGQSGGIQRRASPKLKGLREEVSGSGFYTLVLEFEGPLLSAEDWDSKKDKFASFFGPGITSEIAHLGNGKVDVKLIADGGRKA